MLFTFAETTPQRQSGTEFMAMAMEEKVLHLAPSLANYNWSLIPGEFTYDPFKPIVMWVHAEQSSEIHKDLFKNLKHRVSAFIFVSYWQMNEYVKEHDLDQTRCFVMKNAIEPIPQHTKPSTDIVNITYMSGLDRGLHALLRGLEVVKDQNIKVNLFGHLKGVKTDDPRVVIHGKVPREEVREFLTKTHIFAYPATFEETSCISLMEAMSAGCYCVHTSYAALAETSMGLTHMYEHNDTWFLQSERFGIELPKAIDNVRRGWDPSLQIAAANSVYDWKVRVPQWVELSKKLEKLAFLPVTPFPF